MVDQTQLSTHRGTPRHFETASSLLQQRNAFLIYFRRRWPAMVTDETSSDRSIRVFRDEQVQQQYVEGLIAGDDRRTALACVGDGDGHMVVFYSGKLKVAEFDDMLISPATTAQTPEDDTDIEEPGLLWGLKILAALTPTIAALVFLGLPVAIKLLYTIRAYWFGPFP